MPLAQAPLGMHWPTLDPFLFCAHHDDRYPRGNGRFGPAASLAGRQMGSDFSRKDGWSMYHGQTVPGFPAHPHRGFETVTLVRRGRIDHSDSLGAAARFGDGDVQWLTAGRGIVHAEMFPLLETDRDNPAELFQIWLNLPGRRKMCEPYFSMLWADRIRTTTIADAQGRLTRVTTVAGRLAGLDLGVPPPPPPDSWAREADADLGIFTVAIEPGARFTLPAAAGARTQRVAYFFAGQGLRLDDQDIGAHAALQLDARHETELHNAGDALVELLVLQGRPIGEPVAQYGPFVMNTKAEVQAAFADYERTRFGGWPWDSDGPVHGTDGARFARRPDGSVERPAGKASESVAPPTGIEPVSGA